MGKGNLNDRAAVMRYDRSCMLELIALFPAQCREAVAIGRSFTVRRSFARGYETIVCTGLGGSAIGADIARSYLADTSGTPIFVNRNYGLPAFVNKKSIVIASSYSGNTEETLAAYKDARSRGARIIAITSGGQLKKIASADGCPVVIIPDHLPPRAALGYSFFTLLSVLAKLGVVGDQSKEMNEAIQVIGRLRDTTVGPMVTGRANAAEAIARRMYQKFPVIYSGQDHIDAVATRWRGQLAENAKTLSSNHVFPEMNHNEIVGWDNPRRLLKSFIAVLLRDRGDRPGVARRMDITAAILKKSGFNVLEVESVGSGLLARIFSLIYIGDFVSYYLALLNRRDPTPVERIVRLKKDLARA